MSKSPFFGVYYNQLGELVDMFTGQVVNAADLVPNMTPFFGVFLDAQGNRHDLSELGGGGGAATTAAQVSVASIPGLAASSVQQALAELVATDAAGITRLTVSSPPTSSPPTTGVQAWLNENINGRTFDENVSLTFSGAESFEISNVTVLGNNTLDIAYDNLNVDYVHIHDIRGIVNCGGSATIGDYSVIDISNYSEFTNITAASVMFMNHELSVLGGSNTLGSVQVMGCDLEVLPTTQSTIQSIIMIGGKLQIANGAYMAVSNSADFRQTVVIDDRDGRPLEVFQRIPNTKQATIVFDNQSMAVTGVGTETVIYSSNMRGTREVKVMAHQISGAVGNVQFWLKTMAGQGFADYIPICMASTNVSGDQTMTEGQEIVLRTFGDAVLGVTVWEMPT